MKFMASALCGSILLATTLSLLPIAIQSQGAPRTYSTEFSSTENPLSEGGAWAQDGKRTGLDWTSVRTNGSVAFGTQTGSGGYDDSIALLSGFAPDYEISAVIHFVGARSSSTSTHEVELILRGNYSAHDQRLYECNIGYAGSSGWYAQIIRMDGAFGAYTEIGTTVNQLSGGVRSGDIFKAVVRGNTITSYLNDVALVTATDSSYPTGQPGIGFFWRGTENASDFAFTSVFVTELNSGTQKRPMPPSGFTVQ